MKLFLEFFHCKGVPLSFLKRFSWFYRLLKVAIMSTEAEHELPLGHTSVNIDLTEIPSKNRIIASRILRDIRTPFITTSIYFGIFIIYIIYSKNYDVLGSTSLMPILLIHSMLEYGKYLLFKRADQAKNTNIGYGKEELNFLEFTFICICSVVVCYVFAVTFGAEFTTQVEETFVFSLTLTALVSTPLYLHTDIRFVSYLLGNKKPTNPFQWASLVISYHAIAGAWLGSFVIPLDWDRPWQKWPIPCSLGAVFGFALGQVVTSLFLLSMNMKKTRLK